LLREHRTLFNVKSRPLAGRRSEEVIKMWYLLGGLVLLALACLFAAPVVPTAARALAVRAVTGNGGAVFTNGDTHSNTTFDSISPALSASDVGKFIFGPGIVNGTKIATVAVGGLSATLDTAATATAAGVDVVLYDNDFTGVNGRELHLFTGSYDPSPVTILADLTPIEANYTGYAAQELELTYGYVDPSGSPTAQGQLMSFKPTDALVPNTITGWWIDDGVNVLRAARLASGVGLTDATKELALVYQEGYPPGPGMIQVIP